MTLTPVERHLSGRFDLLKMTTSQQQLIWLNISFGKMLPSFYV